MVERVIGIVTRSNPMTDRMAWSGTPYKIREAVENAGFVVKWIKVHPNIIALLFLKILFKIVGQSRYLFLTNIYTWLAAKSINTKDVMSCDFLLFPGGAQITKFLTIPSCKMPPVIYVTDSCFRQMADYYWNGIPDWIYRQADKLEKAATDNSTLVIKSSDWALSSALMDYGCPTGKTAVLEFGANIDENDICISEPYMGGELRILFSGVYWKRKGCDIAIDTVKKLNEKGIHTKLYLVGLDKNRIPSKYRNLRFVEYVGFLNKNNSQQYNRYIEIISHSHCLLLPTRAECSAIVLCEMAAFGLPSFTYDTGGLSNYVVNGETGYRLSTESTSEDFANVIEASVKKNEFVKLQRGALSLYKEKTSWSAWSRRFISLMDEKMNSNK